MGRMAELWAEIQRRAADYCLENDPAYLEWLLEREAEARKYLDEDYEYQTLNERSKDSEIRSETRD